jgi:flagellar FliJ protein
MSFQFRFASILQLRRQQRDEAGAAVGQANEAIRRIDDQLDAIGRERESFRRGPGDDRVGDVSVDRLLARGRYDLQLQAQIHALGETRSKLIQELERRKQVLVAAQAEVKRYDRLQEKERNAYLAEQFKHQQAEADDATAGRYTIKRRSKRA